MIKLKFNGKTMSSDGIADAIHRSMIESATTEIREKIGSIRDPDTGEFPVINVIGKDLSSIKLTVEGSEKLLALVQAKLGQEDATEAQGEIKAAKVFLSYAFENKGVAKQVATILQANGIETFWAEWDISAGDSLRQKIDEGIGSCTHFIVLLTPQSIGKPWVNAEMDAGLVRKIQQNAKFIVLRDQLPTTELPPLLTGLFAPSLSDDPNLSQLVNDIRGITKKPPLGVPAVTTVATQIDSSRYSAGAIAIAKIFVEESTDALFGTPQLSLEELATRTSLSQDDIEDAIHELRGFIVHRFDYTYPEDSLFAEFDALWKPWNPRDDAKRLAADLLNDRTMPDALSEIAARYGWPPRRMNPAAAFLQSRELADISQTLGNAPWLCHWISANAATRRFVKSSNL
jgi:TIR domain